MVPLLIDWLDDGYRKFVYRYDTPISGDHVILLEANISFSRASESARSNFYLIEFMHVFSSCLWKSLISPGNWYSGEFILSSGRVRIRREKSRLLIHIEPEQSELSDPLEFNVNEFLDEFAVFRKEVRFLLVNNNSSILDASFWRELFPENN